MKKCFRLAAIVVGTCLSLALGGCAGDGLTSSGVMAGNSSDPMQKVTITKSDYDPQSGANPITYAQYQAVGKVAARLQIQIDWQTSGNGEACLSEGMPYAAAGAIGGATTGLFYPGGGLLAGPAAGVSGVTYGLGGCVNGIVTHSYNGSYEAGDSIEKAIRDLERDRREFLTADGRSLFHDIHVSASFVRSLNTTDSPAPELAKHMPDFHGPAPGTPVQ